MSLDIAERWRLLLPLALLGGAVVVSASAAGAAPGRGEPGA